VVGCGVTHSKEKKRERERKCEHLNNIDITHSSLTGSRIFFRVVCSRLFYVPPGGGWLFKLRPVTSYSVCNSVTLSCELSLTYLNFIGFS